MKVSIITVTYNSAQTLTDTIESVLSQTYLDIEYLIIDGKSTDNTISIVQSYQKKFQGRLHWLSEKDKGLYDAMNKGIRMATGEIIGILNSDDFFTSCNIIEKIVAAFTEDVEAVYGDVHFVRNNNLKKCIRYYSGAIFRPWMVKFGFIAPHPSFYIRKNIYEKYGVYSLSYKISADFELIARICYKYQIRTKYLHLDMVTMRNGGISTKNLRNRALGLKETIIACKRLEIKTNSINIRFKYIIKMFSAIFIRR